MRLTRVFVDAPLASDAQLQLPAGPAHGIGPGLGPSRATVK